MNVNAFGVAYSENNLRLFPGQEKDVELRMQNMVGDDEIQLSVVLRDSAGIASLKEKVYTLLAKTESMPVAVRIKIPKDAQIGEKYVVIVAFDTAASGEGGGVSLGTGMDVKIYVEVVQEYFVEPQLSPMKENFNLIIAGIISLIVIVIVVLIILKRRKKGSGNLRYG
jgi:hypothetical protein